MGERRRRAASTKNRSGFYLVSFFGALLTRSRSSSSPSPMLSPDRTTAHCYTLLQTMTRSAFVLGEEVPQVPRIGARARNFPPYVSLSSWFHWMEGGIITYISTDLFLGLSSRRIWRNLRLKNDLMDRTYLFYLSHSCRVSLGAGIKAGCTTTLLFSFTPLFPWTLSSYIPSPFFFYYPDRTYAYTRSSRNSTYPIPTTLPFLISPFNIIVPTYTHKYIF